MKPEITQMNLFAMQVCVPKTFTDQEVLDFAEETSPCGTTQGWAIRKGCDVASNGYPERNPCDKRDGCVHIVLDA